ncbi:MAG: hypothetical protein D6824_01690 [Planctomycetota bacterium]|nr:MAG: hypothetical protein D6824_01690 [Planctomycetota bacterium]
MHIVTKILVVFAAILAALLSALTVAYTHNASQIVRDRQRLSQMVAARDADLRARDAQFAAAQRQFDQERQNLASQIASLTQEQASLRNENTKLVADAKSAQIQAASLQSQIEQMTATEKTMALLIESYRNELTSLREGQLRSAEREQELADRINDLTGQLQVAQDNNRALQEQLAELQASLSSGAVASTATGRGGAAGSSNVVQARVLSVSPDRASGQLLAEIDAGSNDRVRKGMTLNIVRDGRFLGRMIVTRVDLQRAVGRIDTLNNRNVRVQPGDIVLSSLR